MSSRSLTAATRRRGWTISPTKATRALRRSASSTRCRRSRALQIDFAACFWALGPARLKARPTLRPSFELEVREPVRAGLCEPESIAQPRGRLAVAAGSEAGRAGIGHAQRELGDDAV